MESINPRMLIGPLVMVIAVAGAYYLHVHKKPVQKPDPLPGISEQYAAPPKTHPNIPDDAWQWYEDAKDAVYNMDYPRAETDLLNAVRIKPDFTEAWYNLGATQANMALVEIRNHHESDAVRKFRVAVDSKRKARDLMKQGKWFEYNEEQQRQTRYDADMALADADAVLADEPALIDAMRAWAGVEN